jgi:hypothetical protein
MDPLKPLSSLIRSLAIRSRSREDHAPRTGATVPGPVPLTARLRARLPSLRQWDEAHARHVFVECVLLDQLGAELHTDSAFVDLVQRASDALGSRPRVTARLDQVLRELATPSSS